MDVDCSNINPALANILKDPRLNILLDANFLIPPHRSLPKVPRITFSEYEKIWLIPLFNTFSNLSVHESVYAELVSSEAKNFANNKIESAPQELSVYLNSSLTPSEKKKLKLYVEQRSPFSQYDPKIPQITTDKGEIESLGYMAVKGLIYFATHDSLPIRLITKIIPDKLGITSLRALRLYEIIYCLHKLNNGAEGEKLRFLYRYQYCLTAGEKKQNPAWGEFMRAMDILYSCEENG